LVACLPEILLAKLIKIGGRGVRPFTRPVSGGKTDTSQRIKSGKKVKPGIVPVAGQSNNNSTTPKLLSRLSVNTKAPQLTGRLELF
jgi:hypothetical protein